MQCIKYMNNMGTQQCCILIEIINFYPKYNIMNEHMPYNTLLNNNKQMWSFQVKHFTSVGK